MCFLMFMRVILTLIYFFYIYELLASDETSLIKEALLDIMGTTCIKFVPRFDEHDYSVIMEYKSPDQKIGFVDV